MHAYLLKGGLVAELWPAHVGRVDLRVAGGRIVERGHNLAPAGEEVLDVSGRVVMPGFVCAHTHLYSALARGMPGPAAPPENFRQILERVWWRLDRALDEEALRASALVGALEAIRAGTTTLIDHNSSPGFLRGSLDLIARALQQAGLRGILCYEISDRGGPAERDAAVAEHQAFLGAQRPALVRGMIGGHASFTLEPDTLARMRALVAQHDVGAHVHLAEDGCDVADARRRGFPSPASRLAEAGLLGPASLLAHGTLLDDDALRVVEQSGAWLVHNPRSNMNNAVGHAPLAHMGDRVALGTDGLGADMFAEAQAAFLRAREAGDGCGGEQIARMVANGARFASRYFGLPLATLHEGAAADLVVLDYQPPTPLHAGNLPWHFLFGMGAHQVESVMIAGRLVLRERRFPHVDERPIYAAARVTAAWLWERMAQIPEQVYEPFEPIA